MNSYGLLKKNIEEQINNLNIFFAFDEKQLQEGMKKIGVTEKSELVQCLQGGFMSRDYIPTYNAIMQKIEQDEKTFLENTGNLFDAFYYELCNHEYDYTRDDTDTLESLGFKKENLTDRQKEILKEAKQKCIENSD